MDTTVDAVEFSGDRSCYEFLRSVRTVAFKNGKHKDGDWMAGYASTCFVAEAARWFEDLDDEVQGDWKLLRKALIERFPMIDEQSPSPAAALPAPASLQNCILTDPAIPISSRIEPQQYVGTAPTSSATIQPFEPRTATPEGTAQPKQPRKLLATSQEEAQAAPAFSPSTERRALALGSDEPVTARLAISGDKYNSPIRGYISKTLIKGYFEAVDDLNDALCVEFTPSGSAQPVEFCLLNSPSLPQSNLNRLGMIWHEASPKIAARSPHNALCVAVEDASTSKKVSCEAGHHGPVATMVWSVAEDGSVRPVWETDSQNYYELLPVFYVAQKTKRLLFVADWSAWIKTRNMPSSCYHRSRITLDIISVTTK
ncbi:hypothetical protein FRB90_004772 [Tulasnella sp. 427]|nr:hypothetical protein FRB90_004772 [Tulasnella sp. 427]